MERLWQFPEKSPKRFMRNTVFVDPWVSVESEGCVWGFPSDETACHLPQPISGHLRNIWATSLV